MIFTLSICILDFTEAAIVAICYSEAFFAPQTTFDRSSRYRKFQKTPDAIGCYLIYGANQRFGVVNRDIAFLVKEQNYWNQSIE